MGVSIVVRAPQRTVEIYISQLKMTQTILNTNETGGLGEIKILHSTNTSSLTPASRTSIKAIGEYHHLLQGTGIDWGSGTGCLAISAAKITEVKQVFGLEISSSDIEIAHQNAQLNNVENKTAFFLSNSYLPFNKADQKSIDALLGKTNFILSNPPSSEGDDGFGYRRLILRDSRKFLMKDGVVFLSISYQYGHKRIEGLCQQISGFKYGGILVTTEWVPFDLKRPELLHCLMLYAEEESRGGLPYEFSVYNKTNINIDAQSALADFRKTGISPLTKWQTHLFQYVG